MVENNSVRYCICPFCGKAYKLPREGDIPLCWHGIGVRMREAFTTDKIMVYDHTTCKDREITDKDIKKYESYLNEVNH